jgi:Protein of unknown function (DUF3017)
MDFGHRVYATEDPHGAYLRVTSAEHAGTRGDDPRFLISRRTEEVVAMTRQARHALPGFEPSAVPPRETGGTGRSGKAGGEAELAGTLAAVPWPAQDPPAAPAAPVQPAAVTAARETPAHARSTRPGTAGAVAYLVVVIVVAAGVYMAWREGSQGGGRGGVVAGSALLLAAVTRLVLPGRAAGLLASRRRVTDVLTLTVFGASLLVAGLVLPRLGPPSAQGNGRPADERETRITCPKSRWRILSSS